MNVVLLAVLVVSRNQFARLVALNYVAMTEHRLAPGKALIASLADLGASLGYAVEREFPIDETERGDPPAVDVAWFAETGQRFPLFIFEVESAPGNTMANNALKIYARDSFAFEKPLFFFHLIATGGGESSRVANLQRQYGTQNYRIYRLGEDQGIALISDVLSQHRRIRDHVNYVDLHTLFSRAPLRAVADPVSVLRSAADLQFANPPLAAYVHLAQPDESLLPDLVRIIQMEHDNEWTGLRGFSSYVGYQWGIPILCALMTSLDTHLGADVWSRRLLEWQNNSSYMPQITPALGLSHDYDHFLLSTAPPLVTLCCAIGTGEASFCRELIQVLTDVIRTLSSGRFGIHTASWLCHLAARCNLQEPFDLATRYIIDSGGVLLTAIMFPQSGISISEPNNADYPAADTVTDNLDISIEQFARLAIEQHRRKAQPRYTLALRALDDDVFPREWSRPILRMLWSQ